MAPKPFKPPRPSKSNSATSSKHGTPATGSSSIRPTGITKKSSSSRKTAADKRTKSGNPSLAKTKRVGSTSRLSTGSAARLPSLSPLTSDGEVQQSIEQEIQISDTEEASIQPRVQPAPRRPARPARRSSGQRASEVDNPSAAAAHKDAAIPRDLVAVLLNEMFKNGVKTDAERPNPGAGHKPGKERGHTRLTKQAVGVAGKYLDTFVREAVARATCEVFERCGDGVLEVEDLERLAPQLVLDF
ncbi:hypothetical protein K3495_g5214 [Podosphaera aphanis]|nr:hypothetical protein K3495_g5214 [Podosphaera aphanis]